MPRLVKRLIFAQNPLNIWQNLKIGKLGNSLFEVLQVRPDYIEHQLAHAVRDPDGRAYNRTAHLIERKQMMQQWADYLDALKTQVDVTIG